MPWRTPSGSPRASLSRHSSLGFSLTAAAGTKLRLSDDACGPGAIQRALNNGCIPATLHSSAQTADGIPEPFTIDLADTRCAMFRNLLSRTPKAAILCNPVLWLEVDQITEV